MAHVILYIDGVLLATDIVRLSLFTINKISNSFKEEGNGYCNEHKASSLNMNITDNDDIIMSDMLNLNKKT